MLIEEYNMMSKLVSLLHHRELSYLLSLAFSQQSINSDTFHTRSHFPHFHTFCFGSDLKDKKLISTGRLNQDRGFILSEDVNHPLLHPPAPHPQEDLHHLSCSSFWLAWHFLSLSCSTVGASGSVFLRGVEGAAAEDPAGSGHAEQSFVCISTYADLHMCSTQTSGHVKLM